MGSDMRSGDGRRGTGDGGASRYSRSTTMAKPSPPAAHTVIRPNCPLRRASSWQSVVVMRAPVAPNGWPMAIEPPITLRRSGSTSPTGVREPRALGPVLRGEALQVREHLRGKGLVHLDQRHVAQRESGALERDGRGEHRRHQQLLTGVHRSIGVRPDVAHRRIA